MPWPRPCIASTNSAPARTRYDDALKNLERLHELGCKLALDDYGAGHSTLAYLRRLPLDELKIDKSTWVRESPWTLAAREKTSLRRVS